VVEDVTAPPQVRAAVVVIGVEAFALLVLVGVLLTKSATGSPNSLARALLLAALALVGAGALAAAGRSLLRLRPAARTPIVVLQLLALPVSYSLAFQAHRIGYGGPILLAALAVLYLLFTPAAREALDREIGG
jgi:hypothetical protein